MASLENFIDIHGSAERTFLFPTHLQPLGFLPRISCDLQLARPKCLCTERLMGPRWFLGTQLVCGCVSNRQTNKM